MDMSVIADSRKGCIELESVPTVLSEVHARRLIRLLSAARKELGSANTRPPLRVVEDDDIPGCPHGIDGRDCHHCSPEDQ